MQSGIDDNYRAPVGGGHSVSDQAFSTTTRMSAPQPPIASAVLLDNSDNNYNTWTSTTGEKITVVIPVSEDAIPTNNNNQSATTETTQNTATTTAPTQPIPTAPKGTGGNSLSDYTQKEYAFMISAGLLLAFNAGFINGACLSGLLTSTKTEQSVVGFTAMFTDTALELEDGDVNLFGFLMSMILSFMAGAFIAGLLTPQAQPYRIFPTYAPTFFIGSIFLTCGSVIAALDVGGDRCFFLVAAANGIQNGISSQYSANLIRSTHFTGISTDAGLFLGQLLWGNKKNLWRLKVLISLTIAFWTGSLVSYYTTDRFTSYTLLFNAGLFQILGISLVLFVVQNLEVSITDALFGTWQWKKTLNKLDIMQGGSVDEERALEVFDRLDIDGSGEIDAKELFLVLQAVGVRGMSMESVKMMISIVDDDGNGEISREEWLNLVRGKKRK